MRIKGPCRTRGNPTRQGESAPMPGRAGGRQNLSRFGHAQSTNSQHPSQVCPRKAPCRKIPTEAVALDWEALSPELPKRCQADDVVGNIEVVTEIMLGEID